MYIDSTDREATRREPSDIAAKNGQIWAEKVIGTKVYHFERFKHEWYKNEPQMVCLCTIFMWKYCLLTWKIGRESREKYKLKSIVTLCEKLENAALFVVASYMFGSENGRL